MEEKWRPIKGYEDYMASTKGRIAKIMFEKENKEAKKNGRKRKIIQEK